MYFYIGDKKFEIVWRCLDHWSFIFFNTYEMTTRATQSQVREFIEFCLRDDIENELSNERNYWKSAVELYERETGIVFSYSTARKQGNRWVKINGVIYKRSD